MSGRRTPSRLLLAALAYARRGWAVFPCRPREKRPATRNGFKDGTTDKGRIVAGWTRCPEANVAIVTGTVSGLVVLDVDPRNGGNESLRELERRHGELPPTLVVATGGGGRHYFFSAPEGKSIKSCKFADGLDLKADGGYVVAPPSTHPSGSSYTWSEDFQRIELAPCPAWLLEHGPSRRGSPVDAADSRLGEAFKSAGMLGRALEGGKAGGDLPVGGASHDRSASRLLDGHLPGIIP